MKEMNRIRVEEWNDNEQQLRLAQALCARHCFKDFTNINSFINHYKLTAETILSNLQLRKVIYQQMQLPKADQLGEGARIQTQAARLLSPFSYQMMLQCLAQVRGFVGASSI